MASSIGVSGALNQEKNLKRSRERKRNQERGERGTYEGGSETLERSREQRLASWILSCLMADSTAFLYESAAIPLGIIFPLLKKKPHTNDAVSNLNQILKNKTDDVLKKFFKKKWDL